MKIVDVIGEKVYKDGERIITQVSRGPACCLPSSYPLKMLRLFGFLDVCEFPTAGAPVGGARSSLPAEFLRSPRWSISLTDADPLLPFVFLFGLFGFVWLLVFIIFGYLLTLLKPKNDSRVVFYLFIFFSNLF